jgi:predicted transposase/invertase (TIGR01784 family)
LPGAALAENLENWREQLIREGLERGLERGLEQGRIENSHETARNMITLTDMDDAMIAKITGLTVEEVAKLREASRP